MRIALLLFICTLGYVCAADACSCIRQPNDEQAAVKTSFERATLVFVGRIEGEERSKRDDDGEEIEYQRVQFYVLQSWKGEKAIRVYVQSPWTCCLCGYRFPKEGVFLVYAYGPDKDGYYETSTCDRTKALDAAQRDVAILDDLARRARAP